MRTVATAKMVRRMPLEAMGRWLMQRVRTRGWKMYMAKAYFLPPRAKYLEPRMREVQELGVRAVAMSAAQARAMSWIPRVDPAGERMSSPNHIQTARPSERGRKDLRRIGVRAVCSRASREM